jgi:hypothetical protein
MGSNEFLKISSISKSCRSTYLKRKKMYKSKIKTQLMSALEVSNKKLNEK